MNNNIDKTQKSFYHNHPASSEEIKIKKINSKSFKITKG